MRSDKVIMGILVAGLAGLAVKAVQVAKKRKAQEEPIDIIFDGSDDNDNE